MITNIKQIEAHDVPALAPLGQRFFDEFNLPGQFSKEKFVLGWQRLIRSGSGVVLALTTPDGRILATIGCAVSDDLNTGDRMAVEMFFYALPEARGHSIKLLPAMEEAARGRGCKRIWMIHLENDRSEGMKKLYERKGYRPQEHLYTKEL